MSHHIDGNSTHPPKQNHCGDMSFNHETGEMQGLPGCGCAPSEISPTRLDLLIVQYEELLRETAAARDALIEAALGLSGIETQADAAANRQAIINAITAALPTDYAKEAAATSNKEAILAAINSVQPDLSTVAKEATVAKQGTNPGATNTAILAAIPVECSVEDIDRMFSSITEDGYIIVPSSIIKQDGTIPLKLFVSITELIPVLNDDDERPVEPIIDENGRIVLPASAFSSDGTMSMRLFRQLTGLKLV